MILLESPIEEMISAVFLEKLSANPNAKHGTWDIHGRKCKYHSLMPVLAVKRQKRNRNSGYERLPPLFKTKRIQTLKT